MRAAIVRGRDNISVETVSEPACGPNEAILKVESCAVCGSDIRIFHYGNDRVSYPAVMGHEIAGKVVETGKNVSRVKEGDRVALGADVPCGRCHWCQNGMGTNCDINYAVGYQFAGGFQEYMLLNETILSYGPVTAIPDSVSYDAAALAEPLACAVNGLELARYSLGQSLGVIGLGPIGCMMLELSKVHAGSCVFAVQRSRRRLEMARRFRADARFICTEEEDPVETVMNETGGRGLEVIVTTAGTVKAHEDAIKMVAHRGYVNLFGGLKNQPKLCIDSNIIHYRECFVMGSHGSLPRHHEKAVDLIAAGYVQAEQYVSKTFPLSDIEAAFAYHESRQGLKTIVRPGE